MRELCQVAFEAGAADVIRQDAFEAIVRAGLEDRFTPRGVASLTAEERSRLRDAMVVEFEVPIQQAAVDEAVACIAWHWAGDESKDTAAQEPPADQPNS